MLGPTNSSSVLGTHPFSLGSIRFHVRSPLHFNSPPSQGYKIPNYQLKEKRRSSQSEGPLHY